MRVSLLPAGLIALAISASPTFAIYENLAALGTASSSSVNPASNPAFAIDGNRDGSNVNTVFSSDGTVGPGTWWEVDLGSEYNLDRLLIFPRTDQANRSVRDLNIEVFNGGGSSVFSRDFLGATSTGDAPWGTTTLAGITGQKVRLTLRDPNAIQTPNLLEFSEVEIWGDLDSVPVNIASTATITSTTPGFDSTAANGIDGDLAANFDAFSDLDGPMFHDAVAAGQGFYRLDFPGNHAFNQVQLYNRSFHNGTALAVQSTTRYRVSVLDSDSNVVTARMALANALNYDHILDFGGTIGQSILVEEVDPAQFLAFSEIRVFGSPSAEIVSAITNLAPKGTALSKSTGFGGLPEYLNDGSRDGRFPAGSVFHSAGGTGPGEWVEVDLGAEFFLDRILVFPRTDVQQNSVRDFTLEIFDSSGTVVWTGDFLPLTSTFDDPWGTAAMSGLKGQRVRLTLKDPNNSTVNFLALSELEVWGSSSPLPANIAPEATITSSTPGFGATIENGIDQDLASNFFSNTDPDGPIFHDDASPGQGFYRLTFPSDIAFGEVQLYNRIVNNVATTTSAYRISIFDEADNLITSREVTAQNTHYDHILQFGNIVGRTLLLEELNDLQFLAFSEIRILSGSAPSGPVITGISRNPLTGQLTFTATVTPNAAYFLDASINLNDWLDISDDISSNTSTAIFTHNPQAGFPIRFFRLREIQ